MATKKVRKSLQSVPASVATPATGAEVAPKTGADLVCEAHVRLQETCERLDLSVALLNDAGKAYWATVQNEPAKKAIQDYVSKACFALTSLRDEVAGVLSAPPAPKKLELPAIDMPVAQIPMAAIFKDQPTDKDLAQARDTVGLALSKLIYADIPMGEAEQGLRVVTFMVELHKNLKVLAEKAQVAA